MIVPDEEGGLSPVCLWRPAPNRGGGKARPSEMRRPDHLNRMGRDGWRPARFERTTLRAATNSER